MILYVGSWLTVRDFQTHFHESITVETKLLDQNPKVKNVRTLGTGLKSKEKLSKITKKVYEMEKNP